MYVVVVPRAEDVCSSGIESRNRAQMAFLGLKSRVQGYFKLLLVSILTQIYMKGWAWPFITAQYVTEQSQCPQVKKWVNKLGHIHTVQYLWAVRKNEVAVCG